VTSEALLRLASVQQWLYAEARLLDERRYDLWLERTSPAIRYRVPAREYVTQADSRDFATWAVDREWGRSGNFDLIDDDDAGLRARIGRLQTGMAWAETPPSMTRRLVGNVEILEVRDDGVVSAISALFLAKSRADERVLMTAQRRDRLEPHGGGYRLRERLVILDDAVLAAANLSTLF
jgi:3-phenylpropionate/cinnamic acid dioxygenase small subunit